MGAEQTSVRSAPSSSFHPAPHVLRHTFASVAGDLGFSELTIAGLLGHSARGVTQGYVHVDTALVVPADRVVRRLHKCSTVVRPVSAQNGSPKGGGPELLLADPIGGASWKSTASGGCHQAGRPARPSRRILTANMATKHQASLPVQTASSNALGARSGNHGVQIGGVPSQGPLPTRTSHSRAISRHSVPA